MCLNKFPSTLPSLLEHFLTRARTKAENEFEKKLYVNHRRITIGLRRAQEGCLTLLLNNLVAKQQRICVEGSQAISERNKLYRVQLKAFIEDQATSKDTTVECPTTNIHLKSFLLRFLKHCKHCWLCSLHPPQNKQAYSKQIHSPDSPLTVAGENHFHYYSIFKCAVYKRTTFITLCPTLPLRDALNYEWFPVIMYKHFAGECLLTLTSWFLISLYYSVGIILMLAILVSNCVNYLMFLQY